MRNSSVPQGHARGHRVRRGGSRGVLFVVACLGPCVLGSAAMASGRHSAPPQCIVTPASFAAPVQTFPAQLASYTPPPSTTVSNGTGGTGSAGGPSMGGGIPGGGGSTGGGSTGGNSGGVPSPEVNITLGLVLAGGTVAFLRRRRRDAAVPVA
jgi:uncharacterized membrane protein YgcG